MQSQVQSIPKNINQNFQPLNFISHCFFKEFHDTLLLTGLIYSNQHNKQKQKNSKHLKLELKKMQEHNQNFQSPNPQHKCNLLDYCFRST